MKCEQCNSEIDGTYGSGRFCSKKCSNSYVSNKYIVTYKKVLCIECGIGVIVDNRASSKLCKCQWCRKTRHTGKKKWKNDKVFIKEKKTCIICDKDRGKNTVSCCSNACASIHKRNIYIDEWKKGVVSGCINKHRDGISGHIRRYMIDKSGNKCSLCGWNETNINTGIIPLQIDHIDGNHLNNLEENLRVLCPNCHSLTSTYGGANRGNGRKSRYIKI